MEKVACSLVFLTQAEEVYLAIGKKGVSKGVFNGFGGKQEDNETVAESGVRETWDESRVRVELADLRKVCVIIFYSDSGFQGLSRPDARILHLHVFVANRWVGEPQESDAFEKAVKFGLADLPLDKMLSDNRAWLERALSGDVPFTGEVRYTTSQNGKLIPEHIFLHKQPDQKLLDVP